MVGNGLPVAVQDRVALFPSVTVMAVCDAEICGNAMRTESVE